MTEHIFSLVASDFFDSIWPTSYVMGIRNVEPLEPEPSLVEPEWDTRFLTLFTCQLSPFVGYLLPLDVHRVLAVTVGCVSNAIPSWAHEGPVTKGTQVFKMRLLWFCSHHRPHTKEGYIRWRPGPFHGIEISTATQLFIGSVDNTAFTS